MLDKGYFWRNRELRRHVRVLDGLEAPTLVLKNSTYLNTFTKQWLEGHIWIVDDRIVYVGSKLPRNTSGTEIKDCEGRYLVPGYIEPHAHPFQLYNPEELADYAARFGTTTLINDNMLWLFLLERKKAFTLLEEFSKLPSSMYWWARFDAQTELQDEEEMFNTPDILSWLSHPAVVQGGELTSWPKLLAGDDRLLYWIQEAKRLGKPVEGHFPGASEKTLTKMKLLGVSADHESMTGEEVIQRLQLGYRVGLRHSSIRPDLPKLIDEIVKLKLPTYDNLTFTTDGATPGFYEHGLINICIEIAIEHGVPVEDAYRMASYNAAVHYNMEEQLGSISPGRIAHINILQEKDNPHPTGVLAKGKWVVKDGVKQEQKQLIDWEKYGLKSLELDWEMDENELQFSVPVGLDLVNDVIIKPYAIETDITLEEIPSDKNEAFLLLIDREGKWRVNTTIRGFTEGLGAIASSYSTTGDLVFIGKSKPDILLAWKRLKAIGGGIVLVHEGEVLLEIPLNLSGIMHNGTMEELISKENKFKQILKDFGYPYNDPIYTIFFLSSTHLPYIRITQQGIVDVIKKEVLFPANMC
ncbi:adenine deaminase C-terminal domain-containing protein [Virgibacillus halodenitrificans]|uniref:adenine deaminase C-terminal domain-containing protein n=1 Tax=Virgibacillus halodenitrificans TaxID=1482 RepID=UPI002DB9373C|nr:adenine deaminase C-terminal domain-containing protein [Virgibacillus halodenitrificans]MEC2159402.1 adenine deaminase C-terminal domain-containing protein [Virgibacillus halodenitrificans]